MKITTTKTLDERIAAHRAELMKQRAERLDPLDQPRTWTLRQVNVYDAETAKIDQQIAAFNTTVEALTALPPIDSETTWRDFLITARQTIDAELLAMHPRIRNEKELELQQRLKFSRRVIDLGLGVSTIGPILSLASTRIGELMAAAGYETSGPELYGPKGWRGSLPEVEARIKKLTQQRATAEAKVDEALMSDEERTAREVEHAAFRSTLNSMNIRHGDDGLSLVAYTEDGDPLDMTPEQKEALDWFAARAAPARMAQ